MSNQKPASYYVRKAFASKRVKKFAQDESAHGYHVCPRCWVANTYTPVFWNGEYICPNCAKELQS